MMSKGCKQLRPTTNQCRALPAFVQETLKKNGRAKSSTLPWKLSSMFGHSNYEFDCCGMQRLMKRLDEESGV